LQGGEEIMSLSAMKQALDDICGAKLCEINSMSSRAEMIRLMDKAITALRQAIEQAEKQEPLVWMNKYGHVASFKNDEYTAPLYTAPVHASDISQEFVDKTAKRKHEPVAWREVAGKTTHYYDYNEDGRGEPLYAAPQPDLARVGEVGVWGDKREWVGLTDEERRSIQEWQRIQKELGPVWAPMMLYLYLAIEAKLKEKNCG
jgi:hypothetical protein